MLIDVRKGAMHGERLTRVHLECLGSEELLHAKVGVPLKPTGIGIRWEFCFRQIALARFKTDHTKEALKSENRIGFLDMGLNLGCIYVGGVPLRGAPSTVRKR